MSGFCVLFCNIFVEYIFNQIVYFHLKYYELFLYNKHSFLTASKIFYMIALFMKYFVWKEGYNVRVITHCDVTMGRRHCLDNHIVPLWVGDVAKSWSEQLWSFTQDPGGLITWICHLKSKSNYINIALRWWHNHNMSCHHVTFIIWTAWI